MVDSNSDPVELFHPLLNRTPTLVGSPVEMPDGECGLTVRQRQIMKLVVTGYASKNIAVDLSISRRTVENHRAAIMKKTGSRSIPALVRFAIAVGLGKGTGQIA